MNLKNLEERINQDEVLRNNFIKDPVKVLKREGVTLGPEQGLELAAAIAS